MKRGIDGDHKSKMDRHRRSMGHSRRFDHRGNSLYHVGLKSRNRTALNGPVRPDGIWSLTMATVRPKIE
ncbi:hypothetical protein [Geobacillus phage TP-84]|uniref:Uncharacterized protein n=1 Tax=Geobacillus phage TP-84 TaxID=1965361 RepID=A0A1U9WQM1_9CAUD|nr:hypothetical protein MUK65_gp35 [Geobacillus phage TP-84]AQY55052.1 hypothetical protein [Geobacillus phage TP-84]